MKHFLQLALVLLLAPPAWASIALDNSGAAHCEHDNGDSAGATVSCTINNVHAGDLITVEGSLSANGGETLTYIRDSVNGAVNYSAAVAMHTNTSLGQQYGIYYFQNSAAGNAVITLTGSSAVNHWKAISAQAWTGAGTTSVLDSSFSRQQDSSGSNPTTGSAITPTNNNELIIAACGFNSVTPTAGANYALIDSNTSTLWFPEYWIQSTKTATNGPFNASSDAAWTDQMAAFISSAGAYTATLTETNTISDALARKAQFGRGQTETDTASDSLAKLRTSFGTLAETYAATDALGRVGGFARADTETNAPSTDGLGRVGNFVRTDTETNPSTDGLARLGTFGRGTTESHLAGDLLSALRPGNLYAAALNEVLNLSDTLGRLGTFGRGKTETNTAGDAVGRAAGYGRAAAEQNTASATLARMAALYRQNQETEVASDFLARALAAKRGNAELLAVTDVLSARGTMKLIVLPRRQFAAPGQPKRGVAPATTKTGTAPASPKAGSAPVH